MVESDEGSVTNFIISRNKGGLFIDPREQESRETGRRTTKRSPSSYADIVCTIIDDIAHSLT